MSCRISASWSELMNQSAGTAQLYLGRAIEDIDALLGKGYAKQHPDLIAAYMRTAAQDFYSASMGVASQNIADAIEQAFEKD